MIHLLDKIDFGLYREIVVRCELCEATHRASGTVRAMSFFRQLRVLGWRIEDERATCAGCDRKGVRL